MTWTKFADTLVDGDVHVLVLGALTDEHLGCTVAFVDGGASYLGVLQMVQHRLHHDGPAAHRRTTVSLIAGAWRHTATYRPGIPVTVARPAPPAPPATGGEPPAPAPAAPKPGPTPTPTPATVLRRIR